MCVREVRAHCPDNHHQQTPAQSVVCAILRCVQSLSASTVEWLEGVCVA